ncbi:MAG: endonuclease/exonuclease/phosphatase family protein [Gemmatimonadota bacterium]
MLGLQEALRFQLDEIGVEFPEYAEVGVGRDDGAEAGEYSAILYDRIRLRMLNSGTFWLSDTPDVVASTSWGNSITRIVTWARFRDLNAGGEFYVFNTHWDHESQPSRERSAGLLRDRIAAREHADPVLVTGDFNAGEDNPAFLRLVGADAAGPDSALALTETFRTVHPDSTEVGTFNGFTGETSGEKIDAVLVSEGWDVLEASIVRTMDDGRYPSDHFPVSAVLERDRSPAFPPPGSVHPERASLYFGRVATVCGYVASSRFIPEGRQPTVLDIGRSHPDQAFVVVIWSLYRAKFPRLPEQAYRFKNVCVYGRIETYRGWAAMVVRDPSEIWVADD